MHYAWTCQCCGKQFNTLPLDYGCNAPDYWLGVPEAEREHRGKLGSDVCIVDGHFFIRGCLEIPIVGSDEKFVWGAWVSVSQKSFQRIDELWDAEDVENEPPFFGWFNNALKPYPSTLSLKTHLHLRSGGIRPFIELEATDHPLAIEQREGITLVRIEELATMLLPRH